MNVRRGTVQDVAAIVALETLAFGSEAWTESQVTAELDAATHTLLVADRAGEVVGYGCISEAGDVADLLRIVVTPSSRRGGVASVLLRSLAGQATSADRMLLEVAASNINAQAFYTALGFEEIARRRRYYANGEDALILSAPLP